MRGSGAWIGGAVVGAMVTAGGMWAVAGDLQPPSGPVEPTFKTLTEVEPRIAINDVNTPGNASARFVIGAPGSYYLAGDVEVPAGQDGIRVNADDVTIDLNGFSLRWSGSSITGDNGIEAPGRSRLTVRNGRISGFRGDGIVAGDDATIINIDSSNNFFGSGLNLGARALVRECSARGNQVTGIDVGDDSRIIDSSASNNGSAGFRLDDSAMARGCVAFNNDGRGFFGSVRNRLEQCTARDNNSDGFFGGNATVAVACVSQGNGLNGFRFGGGASVSDCSSSGNQGDGFEMLRSATVRGCAADANNDNAYRLGDDSVIVNSSGNFSVNDGLFAPAGVTVEGCTFANNGDNGIEVGESSTIRGNTLRLNDGCGVFAGSYNIIEENIAVGHRLGASGDFESSIGILVQGNGSRIDENHVADNNQGIRVVGVGSTIVRNTASGNDVTLANTSGNNDAPFGSVFGAEPYDNLAAP